MKRLNDIPKKEIFTVPAEYFEKLPGVVQSRIRKPQPVSSFVFTKKGWYAASLLLLMLITFFWINQTRKNETEPEKLLAHVEVNDLIHYLTEAEWTMDELFEQIAFTEEETENLEEMVYDLNVTEESLRNVIDEI